MNEPVELSPVDFESRLIRWLCFMALSTVGMGAIALSVLAKPLSGYYADRSAIEAEQRQIEQLQELSVQLDELIANADYPSVVERAAINSLNYVPEPAVQANRLTLPKSWPNLEKALEEIAKPEPKKPGKFERFISTLASHPTEQTMLLIFGSGLVVVSLTFFNRSR